MPPSLVHPPKNLTLTRSLLYLGYAYPNSASSMLVDNTLCYQPGNFPLFYEVILYRCHNTSTNLPRPCCRSELSPVWSSSSSVPRLLLMIAVVLIVIVVILVVVVIVLVVVVIVLVVVVIVLVVPVLVARLYMEDCDGKMI